MSTGARRPYGRARALAALGIAIMGAVVAMGCASTPPARFYRLSPGLSPGVEPPAESSARAVIVGPFQFADYLDRPQIVTRDDGNAIVLADFDRWAEPLESNFQSVVAANVGRLLGSGSVLEFPAQAILRPERRVTGRVSQLDVDARGRAVLEVQWGVLDGAGAIIAPARRSRYEARVTGTGTAAIVNALNETVTRFSKDVSAAVR